MQARYYDPKIGRFYGVDPVGYRDVHSFNRFAYANNNPFKYNDPDGNSPLELAELIVDTENLLGASAAFVVGAVTGDKALMDVAGSGVAEHATNVAIDAVSTLSPAPGTGKAIKLATKVAKIKNKIKKATNHGRKGGAQGGGKQGHRSTRQSAGGHKALGVKS